MPFTLSHPAVVVPLARYGLVFSALIVGSMSPDFSYFVFQTTSYRFSHTLPGIFLFCVPVSLVLLWVFHIFLKYPVLSLLPRSHQQRLLPVARKFRFGPLPHFGMIVLSIVIGALTHLGWDAVTHEGEWGGHYMAFLRRPVWETGRPDPLKPVDVLQHTSTILGMAFLIFWYLRWLRQQPQIVPGTAPDSTSALPIQLSPKALWQLLALCAFTTLALSVMFNDNTLILLQSYDKFQAFLRQMVLMGVPLIFVQVCLYSLIWHLIASRQLTFANRTSSEQLPRQTTDKRQPLSGEYSMRFGDKQDSAQAQRSPNAQHPPGDQRSSGEYSMRGPR